MSNLARQYESFRSRTVPKQRDGSIRNGARAGIVPATAPTIRPATMDDISLLMGERGLILGMTRVGKSTLAEVLVDRWTRFDKKARTVIYDSKPRFKAQWELNGVPTAVSRRYANWDYGSYIPGSVVIPLKNPREELKHAWSLGFRIIIAQINRRSEISKLDATMTAAYEDRRKDYHLYNYVDELNNFFRAGRATGNGIIQVITSGGEKSTAFLGAAQRPRWISVEAMESMTKLYWFYSSHKKDIEHLKSMGVPETMTPPNRFYVFNFYDRLSNKMGLCSIKPITRK